MRLIICIFNPLSALSIILRDNLPDSSTKHEVVLLELRGGLPDFSHFSVDAVYSFAELSYILILMKHLRNLWVARKVSGAQIANPHHSGKYAWTLDGETVGENLDLYVGSEDGIVAMGNGINNKLSPTELGIVGDGTENGTFA